jgi:hypothetical protein
LVLRCGINPIETLQCQIDLHHFSVDKSFPSAVDGSEVNTLGQEVDTRFIYTIHKGLKSTLGSDFFFPDEDWQGSGSDAAAFFYFVLQASL